MALITNTQAIKFENETARQYCEHAWGTYLRAKDLVNTWNAQALSAVIPNTGDTFDDGSQTDGRVIVTGAACTSAVTRAQEMIADMEANSNAKLNTLLALGMIPR